MWRGLSGGSVPRSRNGPSSDLITSQITREAAPTNEIWFPGWAAPVTLQFLLGSPRWIKAALRRGRKQHWTLPARVHRSYCLIPNSVTGANTRTSVCCPTRDFSQSHREVRHLKEAGCSVQFGHLVMSNSLQTHGLQHARPPCPSPIPRVYPNSCPLSQSCHPTISSSVVPISSRLQSFPASGCFQMSQSFTSGCQSIGVSASASVLPMNIQAWFPLGWTGWISLQSKGISRVSPTPQFKTPTYWSKFLKIQGLFQRT